MISQQNGYQNVPTTESYSFDIESGSIEVMKHNAKSVVNKYDDMTFRSWMKDWMINNPKFFILVVIVVTVILIFTVVTFIQIGIESRAADSVNSALKGFQSTFRDMDSGSTNEIWNTKQPWEKP